MKPLHRQKPLLIRLLGVSLLFLFVGCANQATVVELEDYTEALKFQQNSIQNRLNYLEESLQNPSAQIKTQHDFSASLIAQLSNIEALLREFAGRIDEAEHKVSLLEKKVDNKSHQIERLESILARRRIQASSVTGNDKQGRSFGRKPRLTGLSPAEAYNLAYNDYLKGNYAFAVSAFDAFIQQYPKSVFIPQAFYWKGESFYSAAQYGKAIGEFTQIIRHYPENEKIAKALLKIGFAYFELDRQEKGEEVLKKVLAQFPHSNEAALAGDKLSSLK